MSGIVQKQCFFFSWRMPIREANSSAVDTINLALHCVARHTIGVVAGTPRAYALACMAQN
jgi:hypothetical protein